jgi:hypothetical protein
MWVYPFLRILRKIFISGWLGLDLLQNIVSKWLIDKLLKINYLRCSLFSRLFGVLTLFYRVGWVVSATLASGVLVGK